MCPTHGKPMKQSPHPWWDRPVKVAGKNRVGKPVYGEQRVKGYHMNRPPIPRPLERQVLVEAGHRCAIPTCRQVPVEMAHIVPWEDVKEHTFDNLIALCPTCHARYDNGDIDRKAMFQYKANLSILGGRYGDLEQRVLMLFSEEPTADQIWLPGGFDILLLNLVIDGLLVDTGRNSGIILAGIPSAKIYALTAKGREFIVRWISAKTLD